MSDRSSMLPLRFSFFLPSWTLLVDFDMREPCFNIKAMGLGRAPGMVGIDWHPASYESVHEPRTKCEWAWAGRHMIGVDEPPAPYKLKRPQ